MLRIGWGPPLSCLGRETADSGSAKFGLWAGPAGFDGGGDAAAGAEIAFDYGPDGVAGFYDVFEYLVGDVFLEDAEVAVSEEIFLVGLEFEAQVAGHVAQRDDAEVGKAGLGADGGEFGIVDQDFIAGKLVFPGFDGWESEVESGFCVLVCVSFGKYHVFYCRAACSRPGGQTDWFFHHPEGARQGHCSPPWLHKGSGARDSRPCVSYPLAHHLRYQGSRTAKWSV